MPCAADNHFLAEHVCTIKKNTETLIVGSKGIGGEVNTEKQCICSFLMNRMQEKIMTKTSNKNL
jgi:hypothetical protein